MADQRTQYYKQHALTLLENGFEPIPIAHGYKYPKGLAGWPSVEITSDQISTWLSNGYAGAGVGIRTENTPAVDIDIHQEVVVRRTIELVEEITGCRHPLNRIGMPPKVLLPFRTYQPFSKLVSAKYRSPDGQEHKIEILAKGQQFVAYAIHPDTKRPYTWEGPFELLDFRREDLPLLTLEMAQEIIRRFAAEIVPKDWVLIAKGSSVDTKKGDDDEDHFANVTRRGDFTIEDLKNDLSDLDPNMGRQDWINVGFGVYHQFAGTADEKEALTLFDEWSQGGDNYVEGEPRRIWPSFKHDPSKDRPITYATIRKMANNVRNEGIVTIEDFYAHMPSHKYLYAPTRELWPSGSINGRLPKVVVGTEEVSPAKWLDSNRPIEQMVWTPSEPDIICDKVFQISGWVEHEGAKIFNLYRAPIRPQGQANKAQPWVDHVQKMYPDDADHLLMWMAHRVQCPGVKINHALVLGGLQGIGKDTLLEPLKSAIGPWNWSEISPIQMLGRFNGWAMAVVVRISEARDLGETDRFAFYDHSKTIIAAPPDVIRIDEKFRRETYVANVCGVIITTNNASDGLYLPADDRRHYVAWSPRTMADYGSDYWIKIYKWYESGGIGHVCQYLQDHDLSNFDPKAPPPKTPAFWQIVASGEAPESGELRDVLDILCNPDAVTIDELLAAAAMTHTALHNELVDRKTRRTIPHRMERVGYVPVRNESAKDGMFKIGDKRCSVYAKRQLPQAEQLRAAKAKT